jgi:1-acyl-sn-glycerol-3-phosphate acyltransferase
MHHIPRSGPILFVSNHQSYLDPILVGLGSHRRQFYAMARSTLFGNRFFAWLIRSLNAVPVERGASDMAAMRRAIDVLRGGHALLVYPEGTRTVTGEVGPFQSGILLLIKRANPWVVPVAIDGAFEVWPKGRALPRGAGRVRVMFGPAVAGADLLRLGTQGAIEELHHRVDEMRKELAAAARR